MPTQKNILLPILALFFLILFNVESNACSCAGPRYGGNFQPCGIYWNYDVVFIGLAEKVSIEKDGRMVVRFLVEKAIRGIETKTVEVETGASTAGCGFPFKQGERYFAYLKPGKDGKLTEWLCGATVLLKNAAADLEYLQAVENGEKGGRVFGNVYQILRRSFKDQSEYPPIAGVKITLTSIPVKDYTGRAEPKYTKRKFQIVTDDKGFYLFKEIPAGMYKVEADLQNDLRGRCGKENLVERYVTIDENKIRCGGTNFSINSLGSIEGRVIGSDGQNPPQQFVSLIPIDENGKTYINQVFAGVWANRENGRFLFDAVPPGKYLLAINPKNCPSREKSEFRKMFLPGVAAETEAEIISVAENEKKVTPNFRLLPPLKERIFSGVVLSADKIPLSGVKVFMIDGDTNRCMNLGGLAETKTDEFGRFQITGYESYEYKIRAYIEKPTRLYSELIDISAAGDFENLELVVSKNY